MMKRWMRVSLTVVASLVLIHVTVETAALSALSSNRRPAQERRQGGGGVGVGVSSTTISVGTAHVAAANNKTRNPQTIAIVGTGAVGSYYGARLWEAGHDVHFHMRNEHYQAARKSGLTIESVDGNIQIAPDELQVYERTDTDMVAAAAVTAYDWVIVALKSSSLDAIPDLIVPLLNANSTRVLVIMNGMIEDDLMAALRKRTGQDNDDEPLQCCQTLYGGMALICSNRIAPALTSHTYFGLLAAGVASTKTNKDDGDDRNAFLDLFAATPVDVTYEESLLRGRWKKMMWNLPFNGISVAMGGITVDKIVQDPGLRQIAEIIMDETVAAANTELEHEFGAGNFIPLGDDEKHQMMQLSDDMGPYRPSTMLDFLHRRPMEVKYLFRQPLDRAMRLSVPVPTLYTIVTQIEAYQRLYDLF